MATNSTIIAGLKYRDAAAAIDWLCRVFGFTRHAVYSAPDGTVAHAQLTLGGGMVMLGSVQDSPSQAYTIHPDESGGKVTSGLYVIVPDPDEVYRRAKAEGARILIELEDRFYGGRDFTCTDPEGYVWSAGSHDPWESV
jgi:uncharacterized glyoxalase superfamily protein PhnB